MLGKQLLFLMENALRVFRYLFVQGNIFRVLLYVLLIFFVAQFLYIFYCKYYFPPFTIIQLSSKLKYKSAYKKKTVPVRQISPYVILAAMVAEDKDFPKHDGFDWHSITRAINYNKTHSIMRGGSTISQQTAKNVFLWSSKTWLRKGLEIYFTAMIEWIWGKKRIMEVYLNVIEMGDGVIGIEAAAQKFYKKPARYLTMEEAAMIVACFPNPHFLNPTRPTRRLLVRYRQLLRDMGLLIRYPEYQYIMY